MGLLIHHLQIVLRGVVEGVTGFPPISSTGHLLTVEGLGLNNNPVPAPANPAPAHVPVAQ